MQRIICHWRSTSSLPKRAGVFWSHSDPSVHYALYQFKDLAALRHALDSPGFKLLVDDFDQAWPGVTRSRDIIEAVQEASRSTAP